MGNPLYAEEAHKHHAHDHVHHKGDGHDHAAHNKALREAAVSEFADAVRNESGPIATDPNAEAPIDLDELSGAVKRLTQPNAVDPRLATGKLTRDEEGIAAITYLQGMAGITETPESAAAGWRSLGVEEQEFTLGTYKTMKG